MTCREFADFILDYRSGDLPAASREAFEAHLRVCPNCVVYLSQYDATVEAGRGAFDDDSVVAAGVPEELVRAILAARGIR